MTKILLSGLALVLAASCNQSDPTPARDQRASQALQALSVRDEERVARCNEAADACTQNVPSEAGTEACAKLSEHCTNLQARLEEVRSPAVGCWRAVQECAAHTPEQAQCQRDPAECETAQEQVEAERDPVVSCSERVEACLVRVAELPLAAAGSCDNVAAACERAGGNGNGNGNGSPDAGKGGNDQSDEDDETEDDADGAGNGGGRGNAEPRGPRGKGDAGVADD